MNISTHHRGKNLLPFQTRFVLNCLLCLLAFQLGCAAPKEADLFLKAKKVQIGMSRSQAESILGEPVEYWNLNHKVRTFYGKRIQFEPNKSPYSVNPCQLTIFYNENNVVEDVEYYEGAQDSRPYKASGQP